MEKIIRRTLFAFLFCILLVSVILYGRGYRFDLQNRRVDSTGIIVATSRPNGAKIYINDQLRGATNENIILAPGEYRVRIEKEGYSPWMKTLKLKGEWVLRADAVLFPLNPSLTPISSLGVISAVRSPSGEKVIFISETGSVEKDGIYILDISRNPLSLTRRAKSLAFKSGFTLESSFANTEFEFSADESEVLMTVSSTSSASLTTKQTLSHTYLLSTAESKQGPFDVTKSADSIRSAWAIEKDTQARKYFEALKGDLPQIASSSMELVQIAPDEKKFLYKAKKNATIPPIILPALPGTNQTQERRAIQQGFIYVYDKQEDKNYEIGKSDQVIWHPNSLNLLIQKEAAIVVVDYDNTNMRTLYSGPFAKSFFGISEDGKLIVLSNLNPQFNQFPDLYSVVIGIN